MHKLFIGNGLVGALVILFLISRALGILDLSKSYKVATIIYVAIPLLILLGFVNREYLDKKCSKLFELFLDKICLFIYTFQVSYSVGKYFDGTPDSISGLTWYSLALILVIVIIMSGVADDDVSGGCVDDLTGISDKTKSIQKITGGILEDVKSIRDHANAIKETAEGIKDNACSTSNKAKMISKAGGSIDTLL